MKPPNTKPLTRRELLEIRRELCEFCRDLEDGEHDAGVQQSRELLRVRRLCRRLDALLQRRVG